MLLYNQRKEFLGIDADDLSSLGFSNINELLSESSDFADLFVKKPGYIHNFKNFSWIDFILHSETGESKAIIHAKGRNYGCLLHIANFHFVSDEGGFGVIIKNLRPLSGVENAQANKSVEESGGIQATPVASPVISPVAATITPTAMETEAPSILETPNFEKPSLDISLEDMQLDEPYNDNFTTEDSPELPNFGEDLELTEPDPLDIPEAQEIDLGLETPDEENFDLSMENEFGAPLNAGAPLDIEKDLSSDFGDDALDNEYPLPIEKEAPVEEEAPMLGDYVTPGAAAVNSNHLSELVSSGTYQYNPQVAADELGLPVDLIEEFIGDFIDQAHEFHDDLFASVNGNDFDNVQILSHKLKGVAANLRVEDAFDTLSVVNVSKENDEVLANLNQFYKIIAKLEGKEVEENNLVTPSEAPVPSINEDEVIGIEPEAQTEIAIGLKQPDEGPILIDQEISPMSDDDLYDDLLATPETVAKDFDAPSLSIEDDDLYDDLLSTPDLASVQEIPQVAEIEEDDLYDDLLGAPEESFPEAEPEIEVTPALEVSPLNFDSTRAANELGIPEDIVKEFVQDFKEQVNSHQIDFDNALAADDIQGIKKTATLLKGMSDNLRLNDISEVLKTLQQSTDTDNTAQSLATLQAFADQL